MIIREKYLKKIRGFYDSDLIKVICGIRRCGKSVILNTIIQEISQKSDNIIYLNFEKMADRMKINNYLSLIDYVNNNKKFGLCYLFIDEIQELDNWELAIKDLRLNNISIFITGSNSKLLSSEFTNLLSGRYVSFKIRPFIYKEILEYSKELNKEITPDDYLIWGGMPVVLTLSNQEDIKTYLSDLEDTIIHKDLINRYNIRNITTFEKITSYVLLNNSRLLSARSIYNNIKSEINTLSINTVIKYINYLKSAYIIDEIKPYSTKAKKELSYKSKIYLSDVGFNSNKIINNRYDLDHNLENIVYNELLYMGYDVTVFTNTNVNKEIDFLAIKDGKQYYVQVAYSVVDEKAYKREFGAFNKLDNSIKKILITTDNIDYSTSTVEHIKFKDFVLKDSL